MNNHVLIRSSPKGKGHKFVGFCPKCGAEELTFDAMNEPCPGPPTTKEADLLMVLCDGEES